MTHKDIAKSDTFDRGKYIAEGYIEREKFYVVKSVIAEDADFRLYRSLYDDAGIYLKLTADVQFKASHNTIIVRIPRPVCERIRNSKAFRASDNHDQHADLFVRSENPANSAISDTSAKHPSPVDPRSESETDLSTNVNDADRRADDIHRTPLRLQFERQSLIALNQQLFVQIINLIESSELAPLAFLPGERELAEQHSIGRQVVRAAYRRLREVGIAQSGSRIGWQISKNAPLIAQRIKAQIAAASPKDITNK